MVRFLYTPYSMEKKRLSKALASAGVASRRACEELIFAGRVQVNGTVIKIPQTLVDWKQDRIHVDAIPLQGEHKKVYYMLNKPVGYICSNTRPGKRPIILDLFPPSDKRLFTVGRLDKDTNGLLLVTNDGHFSHQVIHPSSNVIKEYIVKAAQEITPAHLMTLSEGARVDEKWVRPASVQKIRRGTFRISVREGKKHEVRIIAERAELKILELTRIRIGSLTLASLPEGEFRTLTDQDKELIFENNN